MPFEPGQSGNPAGRPLGARNKRTVLIEAMFEGEVDAVVRQTIEQAKEGNVGAIRIILDRLSPRPKDSSIDYPLPPLKTCEDSLAALASIAAAVGAGELTPSEAQALSLVVERHMSAIDRATFEKRLGMLEQEAKADRARDHGGEG
jgi:hypothetical protein